MSIVKRRCLVLALALVSCPLFSSAQKPAKPPKPGGTTANPAIAYEARTRQADWDLMVMDADGANQTRLVSGGDNRSAMWSPDGAWITFARTRVTNPGIYIVRPDGSGLCRIVPTTGLLTLGSPVWSPRPLSNGTYKIVYADQAENSDIDLFAVDAVCGAAAPQHIAQSPAGVAFAWSQNDVLAIGGFGGLFVHDIAVDAGGTVTLGPGFDLFASGPLAGYGTLGATWTEDGTELVVAASAFQSPPDLWVVSASTPGEAAQLTDTLNDSESRIAWSPNFTEFAFHEDFGGILKVSAAVNDGVWSLGEPVALAMPTRSYPNLGRPTWRPTP